MSSAPLTHIPIIRFDTAQVAPQDRYDLWQENMGALFDMAPPDRRRADKAFDARIDACNLSSALFGLTHAQGQWFQRDARRVARDGMDHFLIQVFLEGGGISRRDQTIVAGDMLVIDLDQPHEMLSTDFANLTLVLPRDLDLGLSDLLAPLHGQRLSRQNPMVGLLSEHMLSLWRHVPSMTIAHGASALTGTVGLMRNCLAAGRPLADGGAPPEVSAAVAKSICRFIEKNLAQPLSPESLAQSFRLSRSQIYRIFAPYGGVARYIAERRLRRSFRMLTQPMFGHLAVGAIGFACGYGSESHFSRAFRHRFGITPGQARESARHANLQPNGVAGSPSDPLPEFAAWIRDLGGPPI